MQDPITDWHKSYTTSKSPKALGPSIAQLGADGTAAAHDVHVPIQENEGSLLTIRPLQDLRVGSRLRIGVQGAKQVSQLQGTRLIGNHPMLK